MRHLWARVVAACGLNCDIVEDTDPYSASEGARGARGTGVGGGEGPGGHDSVCVYFLCACIGAWLVNCC